MSEGPQCPYCQRQYTADEAYYFDENAYTQETCDECGKTFSVQVHTTTDWICEPMPDAAKAPSSASAPRQTGE